MTWRRRGAPAALCRRYKGRLRRSSEVRNRGRLSSTMTSGPKSRACSVFFVLLALSCGGRAGGDEAAGGSASVATAGAAGIGSAAGGTPGVGPIDTTGLPDELPTARCVGVTAPPRLRMPCKVGQGPLFALECYDFSGATALSDILPLSQLTQMLNQPIKLPFAHNLEHAGSNVDGVFYSAELSGTAVFTAIDPGNRAFVARLSGGQVTWTGPDNQVFSCAIADTPFWGVKGDFL